jgi:Mor family transcriptional regulator
MSISNQGTELLDNLAQHIASELANADIAPDKADLIGCVIADRISLEWGGQLVYVPKDHAARTSKMHQQIWEEFKGRNYPELARKYNLSLPWVYAVVKRMQKQHIKRIQPDLFDDSNFNAE